MLLGGGWEQGKYSEADHLFENANAMMERTLGSEHTNLAALLANRAVLYQKQVAIVGMLSNFYDVNVCIRFSSDTRCGVILVRALIQCTLLLLFCCQSLPDPIYVLIM